MNNQSKRRRRLPTAARAVPAARRKRSAESGGHSRPPLVRMMRLHELLTAERFPNCRHIGEEFEVSPKTIQRDVNFMRDQMGLPIEYDRRRFGFRYTGPVSGFPAVANAGGKGASGMPRRLPPPVIGEKPALSAGGREPLAVRIRFDPASSRTVWNRLWHPTQAIRKLPGGALEMALRVRDETEIARWVLSWAGHAWIIDPPALRARVRMLAREILARH